MSQEAEELNIYEIQVQGHLDPAWADWFAGFTIRPAFTSDGSAITILSGTVSDQSALSGILVHLNDLNFPLISVNPTSRGGF